jgi:hypothetical protein
MPANRPLPQMSTDEYIRLMGYHNARTRHLAHQARSSPSKRTAKSNKPGAPLKSTRITSEPVERLYVSHNSYKGLNENFGINRAS